MWSGARSVFAAPARPVSLFPFVALLPSSALAVDRLLQLTEPGQVCLAPQPHGPAVPYAQLGCLDLASHNPAVQGHYRNARCFGRLLRITGLCHTVIYIPYLVQEVKLLFCGGGPKGVP